MSDIHVAPCSCELHVRIRELEALVADPVGTSKANWKHRVQQIDADREAWRKRAFELEAELLLANSKIQTMLELPPELQYKARAEKAEADVRRMGNELANIADAYKKAEARVAELEEALAAASPSGETPTQWGERIALKAAREAREREASK